MHWNKWPYWLKGGVIGVAITVLSMAFVYSCELKTAPGSGSSFDCNIFIIFNPTLIPFAFFYDMYPNAHNIPFIIFPIASVLLWFGIGALLGARHGWKQSKRNSKGK